jgi:hypothetical protein
MSKDVSIRRQPRLGDRAPAPLDYRGGFLRYGDSYVCTESPRAAGVVGYTYQRLPGTYQTYRAMDRSPHLAMAKAVKIGPILAASGGWQTRDKSVPDAVLGFVRDAVEPLVSGLLGSMADGLSMGNAPHALVWDVERGPKPGLPSIRWVPKRVRPLDPEWTTVRLSEDRRQFLGLANGDVNLDPVECFYYLHDRRPYDGYWWYGRSLHENIREEFAESRHDKELMARLGKKLSGVVAIAKVIRGLARDAAGKEIDRFDAAQKVVQFLAGSDGAVFESIALDEAAIRNDPSLAKVTDLDVTALDLGSSAPALATLLAKRTQIQQEHLLGWLVPPRAVLESDHGSRADSETHTETQLTQSELLGIDFHNVIRKRLIDPVLVLNFGEAYRGAVWRTPARMTTEERAANDRVVEAVFSNPGLLEMAMAQIDVGKSFKDSAIPLKDNVTETLDLGTMPGGPAKPVATPGAPATPPPAAPPQSAPTPAPVTES